MKFVFPIENMQAPALYARNQAGEGGYYPIGRNKMYHGGIHIEGDDTVVAIADGTLIAYRYKKKYLEEQGKLKKYQYSNCFMLIRHAYTTPNGQKLVFFSHYNHLCPWEEFSEGQKKKLPTAFSKSGYKITASSLNVRSAMDSSKDNTIKASKLKKGDEVIATDVDGKWAKKDGVQEFFVHKKYATPISIPSAPQFDSIVACEIPVKAGDLLGYSGLFEAKGLPDDHKLVHLEVFAGDDTEDFISNKKNDGEKKPIMFQIASGATLKKSSKKHPDISKLTKYSISANTIVKILEETNKKVYCKIQETSIAGTVKRSWMGNYSSSDKSYLPLAEHSAKIKDVFKGQTITATTKIYLVKQINSTDRKVKVIIQESIAKKGWIKTSKLGDIENGYSWVKSDTDEWYGENPDLIVFTESAGTTTEELSLKIDTTEATKDDQKKVWYKVTTNGWIAADDSKLKKLSVFDWPEFRIAKEKGSSVDNQIIDFAKLTPFFKSIIDEINTNKDQEISDLELKVAIRQPKLAKKLSHLICYHQSEWWLDDGLSDWEKVLKMAGANIAKKIEARLKELCWWKGVADKTTLFLKSENIYHWHPVTFVEQMKSINATRAPWMKIVLEETKKAKGVSEGSAPLYSMVVKYHNHVGIKDKASTTQKEDDPTKVAWCASFVSWCLDQTEYKGAKSAASRHYLADDPTWNAKSKDKLKKVSKPVYGSIVVFSDCNSSGVCKSQGHVGFAYGKIADTKIAVLGGNQGNKLKLTPYDCSGNVFKSYTDKKGIKHYKKFRGYYLPKEYDYGENEVLSKSDIIKSIDEENKALTGTSVQSNTKGESSR